MTFSFSEYPQDTLTFDISEEITLHNETVKITVPVNALVNDGQSEDQLRAKIKEALNSFIKADGQNGGGWTFGAIQRVEDAAGIEKVSLTATCRVSERENYNLTERARKVSVKGLQLGKPDVDYSMPNHKVQAGKRDLRMKLLKAAQEELATVKETTRLEYRIASLQFGYQAYDVSNRNTRAMAATMSAGAYESAGGGTGEDLSHSAKLVMTASVTLAHDFRATAAVKAAVK